MKIYNLSNKEIKKEMKEFNKTVYGKTMTLLSYSVFVISLIITLCFSLAMCACYTYTWAIFFHFPIIMILIFITLISFVLGSINYYHELKKYIDAKKKNN